MVFLFQAYVTLDLCTHSKIDWAEDLTDRRSIIGFCFFLFFSWLTFLISCRSKKQSIVSRSNNDAQSCALTNTTFFL